MKNKKLFSLLILLLISTNLISCKVVNFNDNSNNNNIIEETPTEDDSKDENIVEGKAPEKPTSFNSFGKNYTSTKDLSVIVPNTNIYDDQQSIHYTIGEYKETDFINDLLYLYLNEDTSVYDYLVSYDNNSEKKYIPITENDKEKLKKDLISLRTQMELSNGQQMVVKLDRVTYEGLDSNTNSGSSFKIRVAISRVGATIVPWNFFNITVFEDGDKLVAHLF